jgi:hypothetical protein
MTSLKASDTWSGGSTSLKLHGDDLDAGVVAVEDGLQALLGVVLNAVLALGQDVVDLVAADDLAHRCLRGGTYRLLRIAYIEEEVGGAAGLVFDFVLDDEFGLHDVLVAGEHERFTCFGPVARGCDAAEAELFLADLCDGRLEDGLDGVGQVIPGAGVGFSHYTSETQDDAAFVRGDDIDAGGQPQRQRDGDDQPGIEIELGAADADLPALAASTAEVFPQIAQLLEGIVGAVGHSAGDAISHDSMRSVFRCR